MKFDDEMSEVSIKGNELVVLPIACDVAVNGLCVLQVFGRLGVLKPHFSQQIIPVAGDITADGLGIGDADRQHLESNVSIVMHLAATLSFTETLGYHIVLLFLVLVQVQVLVLDLSGPTSLRFGLGTFFGPDSVHM